MEVVAYLCLHIDLDDLPEESLWKISSPEVLYLPWPKEIIPQVGSIICSGNMPMAFDSLEVISCEYDVTYLNEDQIKIEINVEPTDQAGADRFCRITDSIKLLNYLAEHGFLFAIDKLSIKEVLENLHLYSKD